ncbi:MAG: Holliday junction resolvase RecU [Lachnospiraceae bacterium]|nr:Holliday junction resolvase RecU [Lachnospiraceae bacterium]
MATWNSRGLRGSGLEDLINYTIEVYREKKLALVQKIPTPIKPIQIEKETRHITLAYFDQKSTVDYIGVVQGIPICFDAKECATDTFPIANIHEHQVKFMEDYEGQGGIAFILINYTNRDEAYYMPFADIKRFYDRSITGGRKSFTYDEVDKNYVVKRESGALLHFLPALQQDLDGRK